MAVRWLVMPVLVLATVGFFVADESEDEITLRLQLRFVHAQDRRHQRGDARLVGAAKAPGSAALLKPNPYKA